MSANPVTLRVVTRADYEQVQALLSRSGWPVRSQEGWDWAFEHNPERLELQHRLGTSIAMGWVLDTPDGIRGYLGNLPQTFSLGGAPVMGATCTSLIVEEAWRSHSVKLMHAFFTQPGVQMVYSTTANANSGPIYQLYKANALSDPNVMQTLLWVANDRALVRHALKRKRLSVLLPLSGFGGVLLKLVRKNFGYALPQDVSKGCTIRRLKISDIGPQFDELWQKIQESPGLWLLRNKNRLIWRLSDPDKLEDMVLLAAFHEDRLLGYVVAFADRAPSGKLPRAFLLDIVVDPEVHSRVASDLINGLCIWASEHQLPWVEAPRFGGLLGNLLTACRPHIRRLNLPSHFLRVFDESVKRQLKDAPAWPCSGVDGDAWFGITDHSVRPERKQWNGTQ